MRLAPDAYAQSVGNGCPETAILCSSSQHAATACFVCTLFCEQKMTRLAFGVKGLYLLPLQSIHQQSYPQGACRIFCPLFALGQHHQVARGQRWFAEAADLDVVALFHHEQCPVQYQP